MSAARHSSRAHWSLGDIPWHTLRRDRAGASEELFYMVAAASFMEATTDLYTRNLIDLFAGDGEIGGWLEQYWLPEELQHGRALRRYVEMAWPEFDWERAYRPFVEEFREFCRLDELEPVRSLEMASRCVVEMGTATYYTALSRASPEPVMSELARHIADDEVRHYKHFYRYFRRYRAEEGATRRVAVLGALSRRLRMTDGQDALITVKHVHAARHQGAPFDDGVYRALRRRCRRFIAVHFPHEMAVRMLLKPLGLGARTQRLAVPIITALSRRVVP
jgi:hypothetical protein